MGLVPLEAGQPHVLKRLRDAPAQFGWLKAQVFRPERHIVLDKRRDQLVVGVLEHHAAGFAHQVDVRVVGRVHPVHDHASLIGDEKGVQVFRQRRFPRPVAAEDAEEFSARNMGAHPVKREIRTVVGEADVGDVDHGETWPFVGN